MQAPPGPARTDKASGGYVPYAVFSGIVFAAFAVVGGVVAARRPRNPIGWFLSVGALLWSLGVLSSSVYWHMAFGRSDPPAAADYVAWLGTWTFLPAFVLLLSLVPLLFPTGAPPGPRWRVVAWTAAVAGGVATLSTALAPGPLDRCRLRLGGQSVRRRRSWSPNARCCVVRRSGCGGTGRAHLGRRPLPPRAGNRAAAAEVAGGGGLRAGRGRGGRFRGDALARRRSRLDRDSAGPAGRGGRHRHRPVALPPLRHRRRDQPHAGLRCADGDARARVPRQRAVARSSRCDR